MLSGVLMLRHLGEREAADRLEGAIAARDRARASKRHLRPQAHPRRPDGRRHLAVRRRRHRGDERLMPTHPSPSPSPAPPARSATRCCSASPAASCSGPTRRCTCGCWRSREAVKAAEGTALELIDCAFPLLAGIDIHDDAAQAFDGANVALLVGARPRIEGHGARRPARGQRRHLQAPGRGDRARGAADDIKVLVVGNPANTNALIAQRNAPDVPRRALHRDDAARPQPRRGAARARSWRRRSPTSPDLAVWGNHSPTHVPRPVQREGRRRARPRDAVGDQAWSPTSTSRASASAGRRSSRRAARRRRPRRPTRRSTTCTTGCSARRRRLGLDGRRPPTAPTASRRASSRASRALLGRRRTRSCRASRCRRLRARAHRRHRARARGGARRGGRAGAGVR